MITAGNEPPSASGVSCFRILFGVVLAAVSLSLCCVGILRWTKTPSEPWWPYLQINSLSVSQFAAVSSSPSGQISGNWTALITVLNKDPKKTAFYDVIDCNVVYKGVVLALTRLPSFDQGPMNQTNVTVTMAASGLYVDNWVVGDISADISHGGVEFDLWFVAGVRSKALGRKISGEDTVDVFCEGFPMNVSSSSAGGREMLSGVCHDCFKNCSTSSQWDLIGPYSVPFSVPEEEEV